MGALIEILISAEMVEAALEVLRESGALAGHSVGHALLVLRMPQRALEAQPLDIGNFRVTAPTQKTLDELLQRL